MKMIKTIPIDQLLPNPKRNMNKSYFNEEIIIHLISSFQKKGIWGVGITARPKGKKYEIAFGHHRLEAMKRLGIKETLIDVRDDLTDLDMATMMLDENGPDKEVRTSTVINSIGAVKEELESTLRNCETWEDYAKLQFSVKLFENNLGFIRYKKHNKRKIGADILTKYCGKQYITNIRAYLILTENDKVDLEATELFIKPCHAVAFTKYIEEKNIPKEEQKPLAENIITKIESAITDEDKKELGMTGKEITVEGIRNVADHIRHGKNFANKEIMKPDMEEVITKYIKSLGMVTLGMPDIFQNWELISTTKRQEYVSEFQKLYNMHQSFLKAKGEKSCGKMLQLSEE
jgi:hypothetical protein